MVCADFDCRFDQTNTRTVWVAGQYKLQQFGDQHTREGLTNWLQGNRYAGLPEGGLASYEVFG